MRESSSRPRCRQRTRHAAAVLLVLAAGSLSACKGNVFHQIVEYATTPCPFGTDQVVSSDSGTPGLKKLTEKWCEMRDEHGERIRHGPYHEIYESGYYRKEIGQYREGRR